MTANILFKSCQLREQKHKLEKEEAYRRYPMPAVRVVYRALGRSTVNLHGITGLLRWVTTFTLSSFPRAVTKVPYELSASASIRCASVGVPCTLIYRLANALSFHLCSSMCLPAYKPRRRAASTIRKMHVPAYAPVLVGCQEEEKRGVLCEF